MSPKLRSRLFVTRGKSTIETELPKDLGGNGPSYEEIAQNWKRKSQEKAKWFMEQENYKTILEKWPESELQYECVRHFKCAQIKIKWFIF